jgi:hypothetical protein
MEHGSASQCPVECPLIRFWENRCTLQRRESCTDEISYSSLVLIGQTLCHPHDRAEVANNIVQIAGRSIDHTPTVSYDADNGHHSITITIAASSVAATTTHTIGIHISRISVIALSPHRGFR